jgi:hypothetical protein
MLLVEGGKKGRNGEAWEEFIPVGSFASSAWLVARTCRAPGDIGGLEVKRVGRVEISNGIEIQNVKESLEGDVGKEPTRARQQSQDEEESAGPLLPVMGGDGGCQGRHGGDGGH